MKWSRVLLTMVGIAGIVISSAVLAYDEPIVNLGYTSFLDGAPPSGPGLYFQNYFQYYTTDRFNDNNGNRIPLPLTKLNVIADVTQLIYVSTHKVLGGNLGFSVLTPWLLQATVNDGLGNAFLNSQTGAGDLFFGPAIQYDPIMRKDGKGPLFVQRFDLDIMAPTGQYNSRLAINPGNNFWSLNPYWAATLWMTPKWTAAIRLHYLWNARNHNPNVAFGPMTQFTQAGQAIFADIATEYGVTEQLHVGINGYFFSQITDTRVNGIDVPGRREGVWAIGPGMLYGLTKNQFVFINVYSEQDARNRPQGTNIIARYAVHF